MLLSNPCCHLARRAKTSKLQILIQISKPLGKPLLLQRVNPWNDSIDFVLLSSSDTKENPCSFPCEFTSHYSTFELQFSLGPFLPPSKQARLLQTQRDCTAFERVIREASETRSQNITLLMGNKRVVFHFAIHSA